MPRSQRIRRRALRVVCDYAARDPLLRLAGELEAELAAEDYGADVTLLFQVPVAALDRFIDRIAGLTAGQALVEQDA